MAFSTVIISDAPPAPGLGCSFSKGSAKTKLWQMSAPGGCSLLSRNSKVSAEGQGEPSLDLPSHPGLPF